jgi:hypothetical protein
MAQSISYNNPSTRESLLNLIVNLSPTENQLSTGLQKSTATASVHQWLVDSYDTVTTTSTDKKVVEGADFGAGDVTNPTRKTNYTQIIRQDWKVSGTEQKATHAGMQNPKAYHMAKAMVSYKNKLEWSVVNGVAAVGDASTAREMGGIFDQIVTNKIANAATDLTETLLNDYLSSVWTSSNSSTGGADAGYVGAKLKRVISGFTAGNTRNVEAKDKRLVNSVDVYESDFGILKIFKHRYIDHVLAAANTYNLLLLTESTWAIASFREPVNVDAPKGGDYEKGAILGEHTLEGRYEQANAAIKGFTNV